MISPIQHLLTIGAVASAVFAAPAPAEVDRSACEPLPRGNGLIPRPDTAEAFQSFSPFASAATSTSAPIGYVQAYSNLLTTFDEPSQFVLYKNLDSYDVQKCKSEHVTFLKDIYSLLVCFKSWLKPDFTNLDAHV